MKTHNEFPKEFLEQLRFQKNWDPASHFGEEQELIGDPVHLVAPNLAQMVSSYRELLKDMSSEFDNSLSYKELDSLQYYIERFLTAFVNEAKYLKSSKDVEDFASSCKARRNTLQQVTEFLIENDYQFHPSELTVVVKGLNHKKPYVVDLPNFHYIPKNIEGIVAWLDRELGIPHPIALNEKPEFYIYLYKILFELINWCNYNTNDEIKLKDIISQMLMVPVGIGSIFEKLNPDAELASSKMEEVIKQLKSDPKPLDQNFKVILYHVLNDIKVGRKRYVSEIHRALKKFKIEDSSISNLYATMKAAPQGVFQIREGQSGLYLKAVYKFPSIVNSIIETDPLKDYHEPFDGQIKYDTEYRTLESILNDPLFQNEHYVFFSTGVMTIYVPNPGKFKGRVIHVACNSIQDRLNPVHKAMEKVFKAYSCDCTFNHKNGVDFLKRETKLSNRRSRNVRNNVFVSDFSNATDTLSQEYQEIVIQELLGEELAWLWKDISQMEKLAKYPNGRFEIYHQKNGQPQGIICSFDFFALAHHILLLVLMYMSKNTDMLASEFYRILGDDSIVSYPIQAANDTDPYDIHTWLCEQVNLIKNDAKTGKSFFDEDDITVDPNKVILDFAKISVFEGEFCSSLPAGLGLMYNQNPRMSKLSALFWYAEQGLYFKKWAHSVVSDLYIKDHMLFLFVEAVIFGGQQEFLKGYRDQYIIDTIGEDFIGLANYIYSLERIKRSYLGYFFSDTKKKAIYEDNYSMEHIEQLLDSPEYKDLCSRLPEHHKYSQLYDDNLNTSYLIDMLYHDLPENTEEILVRLLNSKFDSENFTNLIQFNNYVSELLLDPNYNMEDFVGYDNAYYFGDGFRDYSIHTIKGGRERGDAIIFERASKSFKTISHDNNNLHHKQEECYRNLVSYLLGAYFYKFQAKA